MRFVQRQPFTFGFLHVVKHRTVALAVLFSFIAGCTLTINLLNLDCDDNLEVGHKRSTLSSGVHRLQSQKMLIILILSSPANVDRRNVIRETWLSLATNISGIQHYFVVGNGSLDSESQRSIQEEQILYQDMLVLSNIVDHYLNLTRKVLSAFLWLHKMEHSKYVLKCDDDSFIQVDKVKTELQTMKTRNEHSLYWGFFNGRAQVKSAGKWKESDWNLCDYYLPYALGGGYVLSWKLVVYIATNAEFFRMFNSEDVSVGVWLSPVAKVNRLHDPRFDTEFVSRGCSNSYLVTHKHDDVAMRKMFFTLKTRGKLCDPEYKQRKSYNYNWNVPPSKCCIRNDSMLP